MGAPPHRGHDLAMRHENAHVFEGFAARRHESLQIIDAADLFRRRQVALGADQPQTPALRAEQRLEHQRPAGAFAPRHGARLGERLRDEGRGRRHARPRQQKARHGFIGAALDGARVIDQRNAERGQRVQHAEPQGDRLQRAVADRAHDRSIRRRVAKARNGEAMGARRVDLAGGKTHGNGDGARHAESAAVSSTCQSSLSVKIAMRGARSLSP